MRMIGTWLAWRMFLGVINNDPPCVESVVYLYGGLVAGSKVKVVCADAELAPWWPAEVVQSPPHTKDPTVAQTGFSVV